MTDQPLWKPTALQIANSNLTAFQQQVGQAGADYTSFHQWSVDNIETFWNQLWDFAGVKGTKGTDRVLVDGDKMPGATFFPDATLNFAENLLAPIQARGAEEDILIFHSESGLTRRVLQADMLDQVTRLSNGLRKLGVGKGDRVCACLPNIPEAVMLMLAVTSLGGVWSSCSPDFGEGAMLDRFGQIEPKLMIGVDGYHYAGKWQDVTAKLDSVTAQMPTVTARITVAYETGAISGDIELSDNSPLRFTQIGFNDPVYILFSSGTTGQPKCIIHRAGGVLLQHLKEFKLHCDIKPGDRMFYFTTLGWMMWNWLVSGLAAGASLVLFDGSPFHPGPDVLWRMAEAEKLNFFGTSAKYIDALSKTDFRPKDAVDLSALRTIGSTGSPLVPEGFDFVYEAVKADVQLASMSGGTDLVACFVLAVPTLPVWRGEIQGKALAMASVVLDDDGKPVVGEKGELACLSPFPSMPIGFLNDEGDARYRAAYFETYPNIWHHGDFAEQTEHGGFVIYGRSDATLNPGGVRIGTAEIYRQVEQIPDVLEAVCIGQDWEGDARVVLFVVLREGLRLNDDLEKDIRARIRTGASPRHVPARIVQVADIPRTKSGKITELAVRDVVHGRPVKNTGALANPEALDLYKDIPALQS